MRNETLQQWSAARAGGLPGAHIAHPFGPGIDVFRVRDKMFMAHTIQADEPIVLLKARPTDGAALREAYAQITPGWHMDKRLWITLRLGRKLERWLVEDLVTESYLLIVEKLPRAERPVDPSTFGQGGRR